ncbi:MAG: hypothetical protein IMY72_07830 [Bacteroidetes bacterium]|nr:hypothetical protein [Bacteroidota bacterium]
MKNKVLKYRIKKINYVFIIAILGLFASTIILNSCKKDEIQPAQTNNELSSEQKTLRDNFEKTAKIVAKISDDPSVIDEIKQSVKYNISDYKDEIIKFDDLLKPEQRNVLKNSKIKTFAKKFRSALKNNNLKSSTTDDLGNFVLENGVQIYWPYSENYDGISQPVVTFDPLTNAESNTGFKKTTNSDGSVSYDTVSVTEEYAMSNPVWIINQNEIATSMAQYEGDGNGGGGTGGGTGGNNTIPASFKLGIDHLVCTKQYDNFWHGGSEFKIILAKAVNTSTVTLEDYNTFCFTRRDISKHRVKDGFYLVTPDWKPEETSRRFIIYEVDDDDMDINFSVKLKSVTVSFDGTIRSHNDDVWGMTFDRSTFYSKNNDDTGNGLYKGFTKRRAGGLRFALPTYINH